MKQEQRAVVAGLPTGARRLREEKCLCGHGRVEHGLWLDVGAGLVAAEAGGGTCQCGGCLCERFRDAVRACREEG